MAAERNDYALDMPKLGSLILTHDWNGEVLGLKAAPLTDRPYVPLVFWAFRLMAGIGFVLAAIAAPAPGCAGAAGFTIPAGSASCAPFRARFRSAPCSAAGP
jgi:hypothetical protein